MPMNILSKIQRRMRHKDPGRKSKLSHDLIQFRKTVEHGFPHKPTAIAFDPKLKLLALGTKTGYIRIYGAPGVELSIKTDMEITVTHLYFLLGEGRLISIQDSTELCLWEINQNGDFSVLECKKSCRLGESRGSMISVCAVTLNSDMLYIGTEGGRVYQLDIASFKVTEQCLHQDELTKDLGDDYKLNPGSVESIVQHPSNNDQVLIGYCKGLILLWDRSESATINAFHAGQQLESIDWHNDGLQFISAHNDGSYIIWNATANQENINEPIKPPERATTPYGPFPCKAINKILWKDSNDAPYIILSGGMPRASYGEKHTISVIQDDEQVVFDISSRIIDFFTIDDAESEQKPHSLVILAEEEMIVIDLATEGWPSHQLPYLPSMHSSAFTCAQHVADVPDHLWDKIVEAGADQVKNSTSSEWPINGGPLKAGTLSHTKDLLLTGHEDGTVRFWQASTPYTKLLYKLNTAHVFEHDDCASDANDCEDEWPPFRKVGTFDPYSDDPRLGVQKIGFCTESGTLVVGGKAGQVIVFSFSEESQSFAPPHTVCNIVNDREHFEWKGHEALRLYPGDNQFQPGFQPVSVVQMHPPAGCSALTLNTSWNLIAAGTAHGFTIFDYKHNKETSSTCTLNAHEHVGEGNMSRASKLKQSLRDSVRRVRRTRTLRSRDSPKKSASAPVIAGHDAASSSEGSPRKSPATTPSHERPIERRVEARSQEDSNNSLVRTLVFANTFILDSTVTSPSLWAGTNGGLIYIFKLTISNQDQSVRSDLCKEIKLRHHAPVIGILILDRDGAPLGESKPSESHPRSPDHNTHSVVISSEEQIKVFSLPLLKAKIKMKITHYDGSRLKKIDLVSIRSKTDADYLSYGLISLSNLGDVSLHSLPHLAPQCKYPCIKRDDVHGIVSCLFSRFAEVFFLCSPSEFLRFSLTSYQCVNGDCVIELPEGVRRRSDPDVRGASAAGESPDSPTKENGTDGTTSDDKQTEEPETTDSAKDCITETQQSLEDVEDDDDQDQPNNENPSPQ